MSSLKGFIKYLIHNLILLILIFSIPPVSGDETPPYSAWSGVIKKDTEWTVENGPYLIEGSLKIKKKAVLTIQPGTVIKIDSKATIFVKGSLQARGTKDAPIIFTSKKDDTVGGDINGDGDNSKPSDGDWSGIVFTKSSQHSRLSHVSILYGGAYRGPHRWARQSSAVEIQTSGVEIDHSNFANNLGTAIQGNSKSTITPIVRSTSFLDNKGAAIELYNYSIAARIHDNTMTGNAINGVVLGKGVLGSDSVWSASNTYVISDDVQIAKNVILLLPPGTVIKGLNKKSGITVKGSLIADGETSLPVIFTSIKDDNYGGDTNGDQLGTKPSAGDWGGIRYSSSSTNNLLLNTLVRYGGGGNNLGRHAAVATASDDLSLLGTIIEHSGSAGLYRRDSSPFVKGNIYNKSEAPPTFSFDCSPPNSSPPENVPEPSCTQVWNFFNYKKLAAPFFQSSITLLSNSMKETDKARDVANFALSLMSATQHLTGKDEVEVKIFNAFIDLPQLILAVFPVKGKTETEMASRITGMIINSMQEGVTSGGASDYIFKESSKIAIDAVAWWKFDNITEQLNNITVAQNYLWHYYNAGGDQAATAVNVGLSPGATFEEVLESLANKNQTENKWYGKEYKVKKVIELIEQFKRELVLKSTVGRIQEETEDDFTSESKVSAVDENKSPDTAIISHISPNRAIASDCKREFILSGKGFTNGMKVVIKDSVDEIPLSAKQVNVLDSTHATIKINTTSKSDEWLVGISTGEEPVTFTAGFKVKQPSSYGEFIGEFNSVAAKSNGDCTATFKGKCSEWESNAYHQCAVYVQNYYRKIYPEIDIKGDKADGTWGSAQDFWNYVSKEPKDELLLYKNNNSNLKLKVGDMIFFESGRYGHVAIVMEVNSDNVRVIQQNIHRNTPFATIAMSVEENTGEIQLGSSMKIDDTGCEKEFHVLGWLSPVRGYTVSSSWHNM